MVIYILADHAQPRTGIDGSACGSHHVCGFLMRGMFVLDLCAVQLMEDIFATCISSHMKCFTLYPVFESCCVGEDQAVCSIWFFNQTMKCLVAVGCLLSR
jgi:hypothetical protein